MYFSPPTCSKSPENMVCLIKTIKQFSGWKFKVCASIKGSGIVVDGSYFWNAITFSQISLVLILSISKHVVLVFWISFFSNTLIKNILSSWMNMDMDDMDE